MSENVIMGCESLQNKALTVSKESYFIGDREIPFNSVIVKNGYIYYLKPLEAVLDNMGFKNAQLISPNTVVCSGYDNNNHNIKSVELIVTEESPKIRVTLKSEFPLYKSYEEI